MGDGEGAAGIWDALARRLDFGSFVPKPTPGIERSDLRRRDGSPYTMLKNPQGDGGAGTYVRHDPEYVELFELMDGARSASEILVEHLQRRGHLAVERLAMLVANLAANGFFGEKRIDVYTGLRRRAARRDPLVRLSILLRRLVKASPTFFATRYSRSASRRSRRSSASATRCPPGRRRWRAPRALLSGLGAIYGVWYLFVCGEDDAVSPQRPPALPTR